MSWTCHHCTLQNIEARTICGACESIRTHWDCICGAFNLLSTFQCNLCTFGRPNHAWICSNNACQLVNPNTAERCTHCYITMRQPRACVRCNHRDYFIRCAQCDFCNCSPRCMRIVPLVIADIRQVNREGIGAFPHAYQAFLSLVVRFNSEYAEFINESWQCDNATCLWVNNAERTHCLQCNTFRNTVPCRRCLAPRRSQICNLCEHCNCDSPRVCEENFENVMDDLDGVVRTGRVNQYSREYQEYMATVSDYIARQPMLENTINDILFTYGIVIQMFNREQERMQDQSLALVAQHHTIVTTGLPPRFQMIPTDPSNLCVICQDYVGNCANCTEPQDRCTCCSECDKRPDDCECTEECPLCGSEICTADCVGVDLVKTASAIPIPRIISSVGQGLVGAVSHKDATDPSNRCVFHRQCILNACRHATECIRCPLCEHR